MKKQKNSKPNLGTWASFGGSNKMTVIVALVFGLVGGFVLSSTFAAKPGSNMTGTCSVAPSPVPLNTDYTLNISGIGSGTIVNVLVSDNAGTTAWSLQADSTGNTSVLGHAYHGGTSTVKLQKQVRNKWQQLGGCSFVVQ